jgi:hypothetical protein
MKTKPRPEGRRAFHAESDSGLGRWAYMGSSRKVSLVVLTAERLLSVVGAVILKRMLTRRDRRRY